MKNAIIYLSIILLSFTACENEIPFDVHDKEPKLILNALLDADKHVNTIVLALTGRENVTLVNNATVNVYLNGELKEEITSLTDNYLSFGEYYTQLRFAPEDVIKIEARTHDGKHQAWAEVVVPKPIAIQKVDTILYNKRSSIWGVDQYLRVNTTFTDNGNKNNYYRMSMVNNVEVEARLINTSEYVVLKMALSEPMIASEDVVLTDGRPHVEDDNNNDLLAPIENAYGVFDNSRINGAYTMTTSMRIPYSYLEYIGYQNDYDHVRVVRMKVVLKLQSISRMQYLYLKALNIYDSVDYDDYFNLPVRFPSNVEGGIGIVGVSIGNTVTIPLEDYIPNNEYIW